MDSSLGPLQTAIYERLSTDAALTAKVTGVFDFAPENQAFPYVVVGADTGTDGSTFGADGQNVAAMIHTWSQYQGFAEVKAIHSIILQALTAPLPVNGWTALTLVCDLDQALVDSDGITRHGVLRIRFYLTK